jgi:hypothetical protein
LVVEAVVNILSRNSSNHSTSRLKTFMYLFIAARFTQSLALCLGQWTFCVYNWLIAREMPDFLGRIGMIPEYK